MSVSGSSDSSFTEDAYDASAERLLALAERNVRAARTAGRDRLRVAAEWARLHRRHPGLSHLADPLPAGHPDRRWTEIGATRLPVFEYAAAELAVSLQVHPLAAHRLMADAVDLQTRLPQTWAAVEQLRLEDWVARKVVTKTRELPDDLARQVDADVADHLGALPPARLFAVVEARVVAVDVEAADARAARARQAHGVWPTRSDEEAPGTGALFIRGDAADVRRFSDTVDHVAHRLAEDGPEDSDETLDQLRARAVGILADPAGAVEFLAGRNPGRGRTMLYVHTTLEQLAAPSDVAAGVARVEDLGPFTRRQLVDLLGHEHVTVRPVIDLAETVPAATSLSRRLDHDHTTPYDGACPPGRHGSRTWASWAAGTTA